MDGLRRRTASVAGLSSAALFLATTIVSNVVPTHENAPPEVGTPSGAELRQLYVFSSTLSSMAG